MPRRDVYEAECYGGRFDGLWAPSRDRTLVVVQIDSKRPLEHVYVWDETRDGKPARWLYVGTRMPADARG